jgi:hypothetical protein
MGVIKFYMSLGILQMKSESEFNHGTNLKNDL